MAKREIRGTTFTNNPSDRSDDAVRTLLARTEKRLRRVAGSRSNSALRRAYKIAADRVKRVIPK